MGAVCCADAGGGQTLDRMTPQQIADLQKDNQPAVVETVPVIRVAEPVIVPEPAPTPKPAPPEIPIDEPLKAPTPPPATPASAAVAAPPGVVEWECTLAKKGILKAIKHCSGTKLIVTNDVPEGDILSGKRARAGDAVVSVNGTSTNADAMLSALESETAVIRVWRCPTFEVNLKKTKTLGLRMSRSNFVVQRVSDGIVQEYNLSCEAEKSVVVGDNVTEVNDSKGDPYSLLEKISSTPEQGTLKLMIKRAE